MLVVVDEAYVEFVRMADPVDGLATYRDARRTCCSPGPSPRPTGSPASGSATPSDRSRSRRALRAVSLPFGISSVAQAAAVASLAAEDALLERVASLVEERARVVQGLRDVGWDVPEPQGNFVWFELGDRTAEFAAAADELGIVVRPFAGEGARVSIGEAGGQRPGRRAGPRLLAR